MPTERKVELVAEIRELIASAQVAIATSYQGAPVSQQTAMRQALSDAGIQYRVVKNTLLRRAADEAGLPLFADLADGPTAIAVGDDPVAAAKALTAYLRTLPANTPVRVRNAIVDGQLVEARTVQDLATVPSREELLSKIAGGLIGKLIELAGLLQATTREFAGLVEARAKQLEGAEA